MNWKSTRRAAFLATWAQFGTMLAFNGVEVKALATGKDNEKEMQRTSVFPKRPTIFSVLVEDFQSLGVKVRDVVASDGDSFEIVTIIDDDADATVDLRCNKKV